jgi:phosphate transport system protein
VKFSRTGYLKWVRWWRLLFNAASSQLRDAIGRRLTDAFVEGDADLARRVLASDDDVDSLRTSCYHQLIEFMEQDPQNIRPSLPFLAVTRTLERLADHSTNIAEDVLFYVQGIDVRHNAEAVVLRPRTVE